MDTAQVNQLRDRLVAFKEGRLPDDLGDEQCPTLFCLTEETANIAVSLARLAPSGRSRGGNRQILFKSEDLPLLP